MVDNAIQRKEGFEMSKMIKYSDAVYFRALSDSLLSGTITNETGIESIDEKIKSIRKGSGGYWSLPKGESEFVKILELLRHLLQENVDLEIISQICSDIALREKYASLKCRVVFFAQEMFVWPCVERLYHAAVSDARFDAKVVYVPFFHQNATCEDTNLQAYLRMGIPVINYADYDLSEDNPEIAVFVKPYNNIPLQFCIREVEKIVRRTIYVPYGLEMTKDLIHYAFQEYTHYRVWRHLAYGGIVKELGAQHGYRNGENIAVWGHPRIDNYRDEYCYPIPPQWQKKIAGRKVILWCPHHTIKPGSECVSTWLDYYQDIFRLFEERKDMVLLWRPHPLLFGAIVNNGYMTKEKLDAFVAQKSGCDNIILDQTDDYRAAFAVSDGIITDGTTFSLEYLLTDKPLMLTAHKLDQFFNCAELEKAVYWAKSARDIEEFLEHMAAGHDPRKKARNAFKNKTFFIPQDQSVSEYILNRILIDLTEEEKDRVNGGN